MTEKTQNKKSLDFKPVCALANLMCLNVHTFISLSSEGLLSNQASLKYVSASQ